MYKKWEKQTGEGEALGSSQSSNHLVLVRLGMCPTLGVLGWRVQAQERLVRSKGELGLYSPCSDDVVQSLGVRTGADGIS